MYFISIVKSRSNSLMEPTSTKQEGSSFLPNETMGNTFYISEKSEL